MGFYLMSYGKLCVQRKNCSEIIMLELSPSLFTSNSQDVGCGKLLGTPGVP